MIGGMGRWEPDARGRLAHAATTLCLEHGYDKTTTADIAARAGLTERTFFRNFADKREALFAGSGVVEESLTASISAAPASASALTVISDAVEALCGELQSDAGGVRRRHELILSHSALRERNLAKYDGLVDSLTQLVRARGVPEVEARLAAELGMVGYRVAFDRWFAGADESLPTLFVETMEAIAGLYRGPDEGTSVSPG